MIRRRALLSIYKGIRGQKQGCNPRPQTIHTCIHLRLNSTSQFPLFPYRACRYGVSTQSIYLVQNPNLTVYRSKRHEEVHHPHSPSANHQPPPSLPSNLHPNQTPTCALNIPSRLPQVTTVRCTSTNSKRTPDNPNLSQPHLGGDLKSSVPISPCLPVWIRANVAG
ncbi:hypothetical protein BU24DRAFT_205398 [Aaosphaeria arxii CBS 175.79]|uniref:Uncharacterized protein n=1 Tax=Aaosphaeria arxii CBS 175.79 TaxID=1450172 RepID=A0A6A5XTQ4_9PLEO|nr:uncharacterized protein BU24DRAFT_205398 [Aaosphaeria arxii CBS 175.79]KAF2016572.1 hypothetical protein BU24DRAFT_205398 [Aaosphaeria arxii CBS 175.79]